MLFIEGSERRGGIGRVVRGEGRNKGERGRKKAYIYRGEKEKR